MWYMYVSACVYLYVCVGVSVSVCVCQYVGVICGWAHFES